MGLDRSSKGSELSIKDIFHVYWPLSASWLLMAVEEPAISAAMARLASPEVQLAAYGGVTLPLSYIIEAPIIMLLSASTALCKDWHSYRRIYKFMMWMGAVLTMCHMIVAFTPLYYFVADNLIGAPAMTLEPARIGLMIMTPWTWAIAYRRFQQGIMIRFGYSNLVGKGTLVRLVSTGIILIIGYLLKIVPGIVVATSAHAVGVVAEAAFAGIVVKPILRKHIKTVEPSETITWEYFAAFYFPLALTSLLNFFWQPVGSAAISRMERPLDSLAVWPVYMGVLFIFRAIGMAFNEVVVTLFDRKGAYRALRRFMFILLGLTGGAYLLMAVTPLARFWFQTISGLTPGLVNLSVSTFWLGLPLPVLAVLQSWYQGSLVYSRKTRGVPESVLVFFIVIMTVLACGMLFVDVPGIYVAVGGYSAAFFCQVIWLRYRSKPSMAIVINRDAVDETESA